MGYFFQAAAIERLDRQLTATQLCNAARFAPGKDLLPLPDASQDLLLSYYHLNQLGMPELYMACFEARRVLRAGGCWGIVSLLSGGLLAKCWGLRPLNMHHYLSPEDWALSPGEIVSCWGIRSEILLLERLRSPS